VYRIRPPSGGPKGPTGSGPPAGAVPDIEPPKNSTSMAASYFDVDGTLVTTNLVHPTLYYLANQGTPVQTALRIGTALARAPSMIFAELRDRRMFNELLYMTYAGMSEDRLVMLAKEIFENVIRRSLFPYATDLVKRNLENGHRVVLISGALDWIVQHLADHLGAQEIIANRLEMKDGIATGKMIKPVVAGPEKARLIREHAARNDFDLNECYAFSDSYSDVPMLSVVGHPAAVNPDRRLALLAKAYSWPRFDLTEPA
jgi:HAD superfamily hydrolase (TIGR01490 family)